MDTINPQLPKISSEERTPLVNVLLEIIAWQQIRIDKLEQEILKLKVETTKPNIKPSKMDQDHPVKGGAKNSDDSDKSKKNKGPKRNKTEHIKIDVTLNIYPDIIPEGSIHKGFRDVIIQDIKLETFHTCYRLAQYETFDGSYVSGQLSDSLNGCHFGSDLISFILYQYHHQHVTQPPLLLKQLLDLGIDISSSGLSQFITDDLDMFHDEKNKLLQVGLSVSAYVQTDDTGARHDGKNCYCTLIGNELFAWFSSTKSKSRINFLSCPGQGSYYFYVLNAGAFAYMEEQKLAVALLARLELEGGVVSNLPLAEPADKAVRIETSLVWNKWLNQQGIKAKRYRRTLTEGALMGGLLAQGTPTTLSIISDDAGQFNVFDHALCWIHAERIINRLIPLNPEHVKAVDDTCEQPWQIYRELKTYKLDPTAIQAEDIKSRFKTMGNNQHELLRVLDKPYLPLHNNLSERDLRDYVKKQKISSSIRSEAGRRYRYTFANLKKTCLEHKISFWHYLKDRLSGTNNIQPLPNLKPDEFDMRYKFGNISRLGV